MSESYRRASSTQSVDHVTFRTAWNPPLAEQHRPRAGLALALDGFAPRNGHPLVVEGGPLVVLCEGTGGLDASTIATQRTESGARPTDGRSLPSRWAEKRGSANREGPRAAR
ncbi:hypothetical protein GCM10017562_66560 [Streptomyces roseofulvus]